MLDIKKALDTTSGAALIRERLEPKLVEVADKVTLLRKVFSRKPWSTNSYEWNARTGFHGADFYDQADVFGSAGTDKGTYVRRTIAIKMIKSEGTVSNLLIDTAKDLVNALEVEVESATKALALKEEDALINGNIANPKQFDGLSKQLIVSPIAAGDVINFDVLDEAIQAIADAGGKAGLIILANRDLTKLNALLRTSAQLTYEQMDTKWGTRLTHYQQIPVLGSAFVKTNLGAGTDSEAYVVDDSEIVVPVVRDVTYEQLQATTDSLAFRLKMYEALAVRAAEKCRKITGIEKPAVGPVS